MLLPLLLGSWVLALSLCDPAAESGNCERQGMTPLLVLRMEATNNFNGKGFQKSIIVDK